LKCSRGLGEKREDFRSRVRGGRAGWPVGVELRRGLNEGGKAKIQETWLRKKERKNKTKEKNLMPKIFL